MPNSKRILVAVDKSGACRRALSYVADVLAGKTDFHVGLLHLELPPKMLEWGGSEDPELEGKVSSERADAYQEMEGKVKQRGQMLLEYYQGILAERRIDVTALLVHFEEPLDAKKITDHILKTAKEGNYGTIVVGRHSFSGLKRLFGHHVGEELVRRGEGVTIWVVE
jgi:nucleotide-binding universal stress UspA family protein